MCATIRNYTVITVTAHYVNFILYSTVNACIHLYSTSYGFGSINKLQAQIYCGFNGAQQDLMYDSVAIKEPWTTKCSS